MTLLVSIMTKEVPTNALCDDALKRVIIQEYKGENAIFTQQNDMNEIVQLLRGNFIEISDTQDIKLKPDLYIIQQYENKGTLSIGLVENSPYIKCDIEGDIYWYKVPKDKKEAIYKIVKQKLQTNIEASK